MSSLYLDEVVPGTVHLVDLEGIFQAKKDKDVILIPQPSSNINDPLRWSQRKKYIQFGITLVWAFFLTGTLYFNAPIYSIWIEAWNCTYSQLNNGMAISYLTTGFGCVFMQPLGMKLGRRFSYLICSIMTMVSCILGGLAVNINYFYAINALAGWGAAAVDSMIQISSTDVFFLHERSRAFGAIMISMTVGGNLGPVVAGYVVESIAWQWCYWICLIGLGTFLAIQLVCVEDTSFRRDFDIDKQESHFVEVVKSHDQSLLSTGSEAISGKINNITVEEASDDDTNSIDSSIPKRSYWKRMSLIETEYTDPRPYLLILYRPFLLCWFPGIIWAGFYSGLQLAFGALLVTTQSQFYSAPPYNFSPAGVGLTNLGQCCGCLMGMFYGGVFVDWLSLKMARRNNGIMEPEFRLWALILTTLVNAAGILAYGLGTSKGIHWAYPTVFGQGFIGFAQSSIGIVTSTYAVDSYTKVASEALVVIHLVSNLMGMGFSYALQPWINRCGLVLTTWLLFMISLVINNTMFIFIIWGKDFRRWTEKYYEIYSDNNFGGKLFGHENPTVN